MSHSFFVHKLHCYCIAGKIKPGLSFVIDRIQSVVVNGIRSKPAAVDCGVPLAVFLWSWSKPVSFVHQNVPVGSPSCGGDVMVCAFNIN